MVCGPIGTDRGGVATGHPVAQGVNGRKERAKESTTGEGDSKVVFARPRSELAASLSLLRYLDRTVCVTVSAQPRVPA